VTAGTLSVVTMTKTTESIIGVLEVATGAATDVEGVDMDVEVGTEGEGVADFKALQKRRILLLMKLQSSRYVGVDYVNLPTNLTSTGKQYTWPATMMWFSSTSNTMYTTPQFLRCSFALPFQLSHIPDVRLLRYPHDPSTLTD
jgi:hypothetical protein